MSALNFADLLKEIEIRENAQKHIEHYARTVMGVEPALHHQILCGHLEDLVNDEFDELIINMPPGAAKTTYAAKAFIGWLLGRLQTRRWQIIYATHSAKLAEQIGRSVRDTIASPKYDRVFDGVGVSADVNAALRWQNTAGGEFYGVGAGAAILGFRCDVAVLDDIVGGSEVAESIEQLTKLHEWYETDLVTRLKPHGKVILICQRLARNDMAGYLIDRNAANPTRRQRVVRFTMECEDPETDPLGRALGERLWPEWFTPEWVADCKRDSYKWLTLYQQKPPSDTGEWVSEDQLQFVPPDRVPRELTYYLLTDLALSVNGGDYTVHAVVGIDTEATVWVVEMWRDRAAVEVVADKHLALVAAYRPVESLIDDDNAAKVYVQLLASKARERGVAVPWRTLPMRGQNKETRAASLRGLFRSGRVRMVEADWNRWIRKELLAFPNAVGQGVDDGVDALGLIGRRIASIARPAAAPAAAPPLKTWQDMTLDDLWEGRKSVRNVRRI